MIKFVLIAVQYHIKMRYIDMRCEKNNYHDKQKNM